MGVRKSGLLVAWIAVGAVILQVVYPGQSLARFAGDLVAVAIGLALALAVVYIPGLATSEYARRKTIQFGVFCLGLAFATLGLDRIIDNGYALASVASFAANLALAASTMYLGEGLVKRRYSREGPDRA